MTVHFLLVTGARSFYSRCNEATHRAVGTGMDDWDDEYTGQKATAAKHSGPGVASFIIALVAGALVFICIITALIVEASDPGAIHEDSPLVVALGLGMLLCLVGCLFGLGLAVGGLMQENRNKVFAVIGLVFNGVILLGAGLIVLMAVFSA